MELLKQKLQLWAFKLKLFQEIFQDQRKPSINKCELQEWKIFISSSSNDNLLINMNVTCSTLKLLIIKVHAKEYQFYADYVEFFTLQ